MKTTKTEAFFSCLGILAYIPLMTIARGWALSVLWGWFVVPLFHLPAVGIIQAVALSLVMSLYAQTSHDDPEREGTEWVWYLSGTLVAPFVAVGIGWVLKAFV